MRDRIALNCPLSGEKSSARATLMPPPQGLRLVARRYQLLAESHEPTRRRASRLTENVSIERTDSPQATLCHAMVL
jgi:hypothetical protein